MLYEQERVAPVALPGPATVVEELNYPFPAAMVSVAPTCVEPLYGSLHTVRHWPLGLGHWWANRQVLPDLHLFMLKRMQIPFSIRQFAEP